MIDNHDPHQPQKTFSAALRVLRGQMFCRCSSPRPSVSSADKCVAVAVLRGPPCPPRTNVLPLQFSAALRGPSWTNVLPLQFSAALRVLRGQMFCRCSSPRPSVSSADKCVAVAVLRGPPCPPWKKVLPLLFFAALRGPSWTNVLPLQFSAALRVLRGQMCCRCSSPRPSVSSVEKGVAVAVLRGPSWPSVDKCFAVAVLRGPPCPPRTNVLPLQFSAALRVLRGQMCCRCRSSRPFVALRGQMFCRCSFPRPFVDRPNYDLANLSSENRQRALTI